MKSDHVTTKDINFLLETSVQQHSSSHELET